MAQKRVFNPPFPKEFETVVRRHLLGKPCPVCLHSNLAHDKDGCLSVIQTPEMGRFIECSCWHTKETIDKLFKEKDL